MGFIQSLICIFNMLYLNSTNIGLYKFYEEKFKLCLTKRPQTSLTFGLNQPLLV